jgi:hypothetical protein
VRIAAACVVLVAAFVGALLVGRGGGEQTADPPAGVKTINAPAGGVNAPRLADTGKLPDLHETPVQTSSSGTSTSDTSSTGTSQTSTSTPSTSSTGSTGTTTGGGGGGGSPQVRPPG